MKGKFIVFEGIDGSGKTTQINQLSKWLISNRLIPENNQLVITREPGGTELGQSIRSLLLDTSRDKNKSPDSITELLLYAADRSQHVNEIIRPTLNKGDWVISDRFCGSTLAYQGYGRKLDIKLIKDLETIATHGISPDMTFLLDIPVEESIKRRINKKDDRIEKEGKDFLLNVSLGFQELSEDRKWKKISAINSKENIMSEIQSEIKKLIKDK
jgi:dTMP kinase